MHELLATFALTHSCCNVDARSRTKLSRRCKLRHVLIHCWSIGSLSLSCSARNDVGSRVNRSDVPAAPGMSTSFRSSNFAFVNAIDLPALNGKLDAQTQVSWEEKTRSLSINRPLVGNRRALADILKA